MWCPEGMSSLALIPAPTHVQDLVCLILQTPASLTFFRLSFCNCLSCIFDCDDLLCIYLKALCLLSRPLWRDLHSSKGNLLNTRLQPKFG